MREVQITGGAGVRVAADEVDFADGNPTRMVQLLKIISGKDGEKYPWQIDQFLRGLVFPDGLRKKMRDEFAGSAVDVAKWTVTPTGLGGATVAGSVLTLTTGGGVSGDGVELISVDTFNVPCRLIAIVNAISQRVANQEFSIELIEENTAAGAAGTDAAKLLFNGAVNTTAQVTTLSAGDQDGPNNFTTQATSAATKFEIDLMPDEVWVYTQDTINSTGTRTRYAHQDRKIPDPSKHYRIRLRLRNTGAASLTTVTIDAILIEDNAYLPVEIAHARGSQVGGEGLAVNIASSALTATGQIVETHAIAYDDVPGSALGAGATQTGTARDLWAGSIPVAGGVVNAGGNRYIGRFRAFAAADQIGTLRIEVSKDNVTWDPQAEIATTVIGGKNVAKLDEPVISRFYRVVYINGATLQGSTMRLFSEGVSMP
jgi:hypothetical protein